MGADLYNRLKRIRSQREQTASDACEHHSQEVRADVPVSGDWTPVAPMVLERRTFHLVPGLPKDVFESRITGTRVEPAQLRFIDTETTGLSGGAGTTVFLIGVGRAVTTGRDTAGIELTQLLLTDYPGEVHFLERALEILGRQTTWVSYNGKAFDARLLETRCIMNGITPPTPVHIDLLYWSRRFWRRLLPDCSLSSVETHVLGRQRTGDIPGIEIPERYFQFLASQQTPTLDDVVDHHSRDIVSLAYLLVHVETLLAGPAGVHAFDHLQVGRWFLPREPATGVWMLEHVVTCGGSDDRERAATLLIHHYRMCGDLNAARLLSDRFETPCSLQLMEEMAKLYEHELQDPRRALAIAERFPSAPALLPGVERRIARLREKCRLRVPARKE